MAIDFPDSPTIGTTVTAANGATYYYDGTKWILNANFVEQIAAISKNDTSVQVTDTGTGVINVNVDGTLIANVTAASGLQVKDSLFTLFDDGDSTKKAVFELANITTATTRTYSFPDSSGEILLIGNPASNFTLDNTTTVTIHDANLTIQDEGDATKQLKFQLSGLTTGQTKTLTIPDANGTIATTSVTQTLTSKTLDNTTTLTIHDANLTLQDQGDATKQAQFQLSGLTTGQTKTFTLPDANTTLVGTGITQTLSSKTLDNTSTITVKDGTTFTLQNTADTTKQARFDLSGLTTGQIKTMTLPDANTTLVGANATQTLSSKTISAGTFTGTSSFGRNLLDQPRLQDYSVASEDLGALNTGTTTVNLANGNYFIATINSSQTVTFSLAALSGLTNQAVSWSMEITNGGSGTVNFFTGGSAIKWPGGSAPTLTTSGVDILTFITADAGTTIRGTISQIDSQ